MPCTQITKIDSLSDPVSRTLKCLLIAKALFDDKTNCLDPDTTGIVQLEPLSGSLSYDHALSECHAKGMQFPIVKTRYCLRTYS